MRLLIVDDHEIVRRGVRALLSDRTGWDICGEAVDGQDALDQARILKPDIVVMDVSMPRLNGLEATRQLRQILPGCEVLILSQHESSEMARQSLRAGARGYVVKTSIARDLISAVTQASRHEYFFDPKIPDQNSTAHTDVQEILQRSAAFENALRDSEERLRKLSEYQSAVMNCMGEGLYALDSNGLLTSINRAGETILGWTEDELRGKQMHNTIHYKHPDGSPFPASECAGFQVVHNGNALREQEDTFIRKDGSFVPVVFTASPMQDGGKIIGVIVTFRDDSEQRRAKQALRESRDQLSLALKSTRTAMFEWDLAENRGRWNPQMTGIYDFNVEGEYITAEEWRSLFHPDDVSRLAEEAERVWHGKDEQFEFEFRNVRRTGEIRWMLSHGRIVRNADGQAVRMIGMHSDITERKQAEMAIATGARQQKALFHLADELHRASAPGEIYDAALNAILNALQCNRASILLRDSAGIMRFKSWRGLSKEYRAAVEGHSAWRPDEKNPQPVCVGNVDTAGLSESVRASVRKEGIRALAFIPLVSDGRLIGKFMAYFNTPHDFAKDEIDVSLTIARQLAFAIDRNDGASEQSAERERTDAAIAKMQGQLEERVEERTAAMRQLSARLLQMQDEERRRIARELHDSVGQMVAALIMNLDQLHRADVRETERARLLADSGTILHNLNKEIRTISHLLHPPLLDEVGLSSALHLYVDEFTNRSGIATRLELPTEFGRLNRELEIALFRIVQECLTNVHRHSASPKAIVRLTRSEGAILLEIQDEGKGITPEKLSSLLGCGPVGVGLRGMRERVLELKGTLDIDSHDNGTTVRVMFPISKTAAVLTQQVE